MFPPNHLLSPTSSAAAAVAAANNPCHLHQSPSINNTSGMARPARMAFDYQDKVLVDDIAGEPTPPGLPKDQVVFMSDLPAPVRILRSIDLSRGTASSTWSARGEALVLTVDDSGLIKAVSLWTTSVSQ
ncbi:hypothetical protein EV182_000360 [Spiromyces aspiralis]|uniref:Uncharacterized protein n=1 Tax=Spiromyces aspiralis TaxID=68401 RepID=A0ACC1HHD7_9FUNG|nr:hypothetical protein EV182_000360 [Spiromyces aspiralis]